MSRWRVHDAVLELHRRSPFGAAARNGRKSRSRCSTAGTAMIRVATMATPSARSHGIAAASMPAASTAIGSATASPIRPWNTVRKVVRHGYRTLSWVGHPRSSHFANAARVVNVNR